MINSSSHEDESGDRSTLDPDYLPSSSTTESVSVMSGISGIMYKFFIPFSIFERLV